jgi:hypothetical protein
MATAASRASNNGEPKVSSSLSRSRPEELTKHLFPQDKDKKEKKSGDKKEEKKEERKEVWLNVSLYDSPAEGGPRTPLWNKLMKCPLSSTTGDTLKLLRDKVKADGVKTDLVRWLRFLAAALIPSCRQTMACTFLPLWTSGAPKKLSLTS